MGICAAPSRGLASLPRQGHVLRRLLEPDLAEPPDRMDGGCAARLAALALPALRDRISIRRGSRSSITSLDSSRCRGAFHRLLQPDRMDGGCAARLAALALPIRLQPDLDSPMVHAALSPALPRHVAGVHLFGRGGGFTGCCTDSVERPDRTDGARPTNPSRRDRDSPWFGICAALSPGLASPRHRARSTGASRQGLAEAPPIVAGASH